MSSIPAARYALYFAPPPEHPLTRAAVRWLGRDAFGDRWSASRAARRDDEALIADPRRYGFHATLKPPMRLADGETPWGLQEAVRTFAAVRSPLPLGRLAVARIGRFFALVPEAAPDGLGRLADDVVAGFDRFRAPMDAEEFGRRNTPSLDPVEADNLRTWGYPYVFSRFRFHMSLTGPVAAGEAPAVEARLGDHFAAALREPVTVDGLTIFIEERPGADFVVSSYCAFGPGA